MKGITINLNAMTIGKRNTIRQYQDWHQFFFDAIHYLYPVTQTAKVEVTK